jgi:hypothetical protein
VFGRLKRDASSKRRSVSEDWIATLPREKLQVFQAVVREWEFAHAMMSVALDEALSFRARGELVCAREQVSVAAELFARLAATLVVACDSVSDRGRHISDLPLVEPLNTDCFRGEIAQNAAQWNLLLHTVLFADRSRFFQKLRILSDTVGRLVHEFDNIAEGLSQGVSIHPGDGWKALACLHFDFNTCLCESEIVLKAFLRSLPSEQLTVFCSELGSLPAAERVRQQLRARARSFRVSA